MATFEVHNFTTATGAYSSLIGLVAAETAEAAINHAAVLMGYADAAEMADDYAKAVKPQSIGAFATDKPAQYFA